MFYYVKVTLNGILLLVLMPSFKTFIFSLFLISVPQCKLSVSVNGLIINASLKFLLRIFLPCVYNHDLKNLVLYIEKSKKSI